MSRRRGRNGYEDRQIANLDKLAEFEQFTNEILPALRQDLAAGLTDEQIIQKHKAIAAARLVSLSADVANPAVSLAASKDILDRATGKAVERKSIEHKLARLPEEQIDALLLTKMDELDSSGEGDE